MYHLCLIIFQQRQLTYNKNNFFPSTRYSEFYALKTSFLTTRKTTQRNKKCILLKFLLFCLAHSVSFHKGYILFLLFSFSGKKSYISLSVTFSYSVILSCKQSKIPNAIISYIDWPIDFFDSLMYQHLEYILALNFKFEYKD